MMKNVKEHWLEIVASGVLALDTVLLFMILTGK